jgi:hypothetical protein
MLKTLLVAAAMLMTAPALAEDTAKPAEKPTMKPAVHHRHHHNVRHQHRHHDAKPTEEKKM